MGASGSAAWADEVGDVYAYFNNDWEQFAPGNALSLRRMLGVAGARGGGSGCRCGAGAAAGR